MIYFLSRVGARYLYLYLYLYLGTDFAVPVPVPVPGLVNRKYLVPVPVPVGNVPEWKQVQIRYMPGTFFISIYFTIVVDCIGY